jgi:hypothetical protein
MFATELMKPSLMVLLRAADGTREGWRLMTWDDFLAQIDLSAWRAEQQLTGAVLPPVRQRLN